MYLKFQLVNSDEGSSQTEHPTKIEEVSKDNSTADLDLYDDLITEEGHREMKSYQEVCNISVIIP